MNLLFSQENLVVDYGAMIARRLFQFLSSENFYFSYNLFIVLVSCFFHSMKFEGSLFGISALIIMLNTSSRQLRRVGALFNFRLVTQT